MCCRYFGVPIETPENAADFDDIRWYMLHKGTEVYVEDGDWYLNVQNVCRYLGPDNSCGIYETRPKICRGYSTDNCEITSDEYQHEQHFYSSDHLEAYARDFLQVLAFANHLLQLGGEVLDGAGDALKGPHGKDRLPLHLQQARDILQDLCDLRVIHFVDKTRLMLDELYALDSKKPSSFVDIILFLTHKATRP